jgi:hypothetical protein
MKKELNFKKLIHLGERMDNITIKIGKSKKTG